LLGSFTSRPASIHQFNIDNLFKIGQIGNQSIYATNSSVHMLISVAVICLLMVGGIAGRQLVRGRFQTIAEVTYEFVESMIRSTAGREGMRFFP
jgi:F-type H+-transporting ATPase subunit a